MVFSEQPELVMTAETLKILRRDNAKSSALLPSPNATLQVERPIQPEWVIYYRTLPANQTIISVEWREYTCSRSNSFLTIIKCATFFPQNIFL